MGDNNITASKPIICVYPEIHVHMESGIANRTLDNEEKIDIDEYKYIYIYTELTCLRWVFCLYIIFNAGC